MAGNKKQWYAMRKRLQESGKWTGKAPSHPVPAQEEGEPAPKEPRTEEASEYQDPGSDPEEGTSARARGMSICDAMCISDWKWQLMELQVDSLCWYGAIPRVGDSKAWLKSNALLRRRNLSRIRLPYYAGGGEWRVPLWKIAGFYMGSFHVPVSLLVQRQLFGL